ncbi:MAG: demethoxyubiquinone hydroxylase family protein [Hyphomonadaceae bacterium]
MAQKSPEGRIIRRILRVNHAGEHGAVSIYSAQIAWARRRAPDILAWLEETIAHEQKHRALFREAMPERAAKPCRLMSVWSIGGIVLGWFTARMGRAGVMACTAAVERTVYRHLVEQQAFLEQHDSALLNIVAAVQLEEDGHLAHAEANLTGGGWLAKAIYPVVSAATEFMIFLSTRGDSLRLRSAMKARA